MHEDREEFRHAPDGALKPTGVSGAYLKKRQHKMNLDESSGTVKIINVSGDDMLNATGYYCKVCEKSYKDSVSYLDHVNSKLHQRKLGYSMRVERSSVEQVRRRLCCKKTDDSSEEYKVALDDIVKKEEEEDVDQDLMAELGFEEQEEKEEADDDTMMALMGFGSFKSSKN